MSPELAPILVAVASVGVALAALMVGLFSWLRQDVRQMEARLTNRLDRMENRLATVEHGQAKLEGLLEGLREAITGRRAAS